MTEAELQEIERKRESEYAEFSSSDGFGPDDGHRINLMCEDIDRLVAEVRRLQAAPVRVGSMQVPIEGGDADHFGAVGIIDHVYHDLVDNRPIGCRYGGGYHEMVFDPTAKLMRCRNCAEIATPPIV